MTKKLLTKKLEIQQLIENASVQQAVWRKRGCCLVGHLAGIWKFSSRPSLTDTPA